MAELRRTRAADIRYYVGSTGSGKSHQLAVDLKRHRGRALVWDWKDDHHELPTLPMGQLARSALVHPVLRYVPRYTSVAEQFDLFCRIAWAVQDADPATDCLLAVEELSEVTTPSCAPEWWKRINNQGRVRGFSIVGTTQSPAAVDKSFSGNATMIRCGRLGELRHALTMGQRINVAPGEIQRLPDRWAYVFDGRNTRLEKPRRS